MEKDRSGIRIGFFNPCTPTAVKIVVEGMQMGQIFPLKRESKDVESCKNIWHEEKNGFLNVN